MEETKIWSVDGDGTSTTQLDTTNRMETEGRLEDILTRNPDMLEDGLQLVGRQTSTAGGWLDLLGVDTDGRLVVYELKRGRLNRDAVAQVIDYASDLDTKEQDDLSSHIERQSGKYGIEKIDDFKDWYSKLRESNELPEDDLEALKPPRMVLVGLGVDDTTERMVGYMASGGMDISLLTFYGFANTDGKILLARNVEVGSDRIPVNQGPRSRHRNRRAQFERKAQTLPTDVQNVLTEIEIMFRRQHSRFSKGYSTTRMNFSLDYSWYDFPGMEWKNKAVTLFVEISNGDYVNLGFHPAAVHFASDDEINKLRDEGVNFERVELADSGYEAMRHFEQIKHEIKYPLRSLADWEEHRETLTALTQKVCKAYDAAREEALSNQ
ncbi:MAG: DUF91 domain-containing protein [Chloroflexi bacterium]|nr:DUF91 domain-containing protein [Chloroflexota bacterium]